ncbi:DUF159-domain-containing protein [Trametopsis cervina]|nr:DUF159-domain-containing protein [Trametopsis cervina]
MCGRYSLGIPHHDIQQLHGYNVQVGEWVAQEQFHPRHNIAPRSYAPVIRREQRRTHEEGSSETSSSIESTPVILHTMKWGIVPHWSKHDDGDLNTINARCEALIEGGGMWASLKGKKRCAIPCEGYYEWLKKGKERLPHFTKRGDGNMMLLAGLYDHVVLEGHTEPLWTFTIVTTDASSTFTWLHDRQPVILSTTDALNTWLDTSSGTWSATLSNMVRPYKETDVSLTCYQVPKEVGKVGTESSTFIESVAQRRDGIQAMFARQLESQTSPSGSQLLPRTPKRKRSNSIEAPSISPVRKKTAKRESTIVEDIIDLCSDEDAKGAPVEKLNTWEDDSDVEYIDKPETENTKRTQSDGSSKRKSKTSPVKTSASNTDPTIPKITSFFSKA